MSLSRAPTSPPSLPGSAPWSSSSTSTRASRSSPASKAGATGKIEALGLIGKRVKAKGDQIDLAEEGSTTGRYRLDVPAEVGIAIYDAEGSLVRTLKAGLVPGWRRPAGPSLFAALACRRPGMSQHPGALPWKSGQAVVSF